MCPFIIGIGALELGMIGGLCNGGALPGCWPVGCSCGRGILPAGGVCRFAGPRIAPGITPILIPAFSAALTISSSRTCRAAQMTAHSTMSSLPSPSVFHTAFSSSVLPVIVTRVPPPVIGLPSGPMFFEMWPN